MARFSPIVNSILLFVFHITEQSFIKIEWELQTSESGQIDRRDRNSGVDIQSEYCRVSTHPLSGKYVIFCVPGQFDSQENE